MLAGYQTRVLLTAVLTAVIWHKVVLARSDSGDGGDEKVQISAPDAALSNLASAKIGGRPIVPANISVPFSVAPQPLPLTPEVAHARQQFLKTFALIEDAVKAADDAHQPLISARGDIDNTLDLSSNIVPGDGISTSVDSRVGPIEQIQEIIEEVFDERAHIFPDEDTEPEYFLPRMKVDPLMLLNLDTPLPPNSFIQEMTPVGVGENGGMCYEIVILEPETTFNLPRFAGRSRSRPTSRSSVNKIDPITTSLPKKTNSTTPSAEQVPAETISQNSLFNTLSTQGGLPIISPHELVGTPVLRSLAGFRGSSAGGSNPMASKERFPDTHSAVLQAVTASLNSTETRKTLPPHFVVPQLTFESFFHRTG